MMYMALPNKGLKPTAKQLGGFCNVVPRKESGRISGVNPNLSTVFYKNF